MKYQDNGKRILVFDGSSHLAFTRGALKLPKKESNRTHVTGRQRVNFIFSFGSTDGTTKCEPERRRGEPERRRREPERRGSQAERRQLSETKFIARKQFFHGGKVANVVACMFCMGREVALVLCGPMHGCAQVFRCP